METSGNGQPNKSVVNRGANGRFLPGNIANPKGRPPLPACLTAKLRLELPKPCPYAPDKTWLEYIVERWMAQAVENSGYFKELIERLEGKVPQALTGEGGGPIVASFTFTLPVGFAPCPGGLFVGNSDKQKD